MQTVVLVIHMLLAVALIGIVMLQRSEGGGLGMGGSSSQGALLSVRSSGNILTRVTSILAGGFILTSLILVLLASAHRTGSSRLQQLIQEHTPAASAPTAPANPEPTPRLDDRPAPAP